MGRLLASPGLQRRGGVRWRDSGSWCREPGSSGTPQRALGKEAVATLMKLRWELVTGLALPRRRWGPFVLGGAVPWGVGLVLVPGGSGRWERVEMGRKPHALAGSGEDG